MRPSDNDDEETTMMIRKTLGPCDGSKSHRHRRFLTSGRRRNGCEEEVAKRE